MKLFQAVYVIDERHWHDEQAREVGKRYVLDRLVAELVKYNNFSVKVRISEVKTPTQWQGINDCEIRLEAQIDEIQ